MKCLRVIVIKTILLTLCSSQKTDLFCANDQCNTDELQNLRMQVLQATFANEIRILKAALEAERRERQEEVTSSTYVRWGRTTCPDTATLVYDGGC